MPTPEKSQTNWIFEPRKPEAERTIKAEQLKEALLRNAGDLEIENAVIAGTFKARELREFSHFLSVRRTRFLDNFDLTDVHFHRPVEFVACEFRGNLDLSCCEVEGNLSLEDSTVLGNLDIHDALVHDHLYLYGTQVGGNLELVRSEVMRNLFCEPRTRRPMVGGRADLAAVEVHGQTILMGLHVKGHLNLQQAELKAGLFARAWTRGSQTVPTQVDGSVHLLAAKVQDLLDFSGAAVRGDLDASRAVVNGQADFTGVSLGGNFDLQGTRIAGELRISLRDSVPSKEKPTSKPRRPAAEPDAEGPQANLQDCVIQHMQYDASGSPERLVKLNFAEIDVLDFPEAAEDKSPGAGKQPRLASIPRKTRLEGLRFRDFEFPDGRDEQVEAMNWLKSDPLEPEGVTRQIERWFRNKGNHQKANVFYLELQRRQRRTRPRYMQFLEKLVIDWGTNYGLRTSRLLIVFVILLALSFILFQYPESTVLREDIRREAPYGLITSAGERTVATWTWDKALWMAVHLNLPMIDLPATTDWKPSAEIIRVVDQPLEVTVPGMDWHIGLTYRGYGSVVALLGYIMVPLYFAGSIHYWFRQRNPNE